MRNVLWPVAAKQTRPKVIKRHNQPYKYEYSVTDVKVGEDGPDGSGTENTGPNDSEPQSSRVSLITL